ncbi:hypothetical protein BV898_17692 [Hypsibius exemplaris]|uniref:C-type lectin domain-containing protein n=1 Tax=Hypsibius exemplaris TaxID=2072580 RepID=A0A9X6NIE0_HYPEX|nr:hypothetical protein BV898_17692 [Hypsibius exemplaris]
MESRLSLLGLLFVFGAVNAYRCPGPEWTPRRNSSYCYFARTSPVDMNTWFWDEARLDCKIRGGYLTDIEDQTELDFLGTIMRTKGMVFYWVGLTYETGAWEWADTGKSYAPEKFTSADLEFGTWQSESDRRQQRGTVVMPNHQMILRGSTRSRKGYICKASYSSRPLCKTEEGWDYIQGRCWKFQPILHSFTQAQHNCSTWNEI